MYPIKNPQHKKYIAMACIIFFAILSLFSLYRYFTYKYCLKSYFFLNQNIICKDKHLVYSLSFNDKKNITDQIESYLNEGGANHISFYFRDLTTGFSWGVNEFQDFAPASLLKVPLAVVILELIEKNPKMYRQKLFYAGKDIENQYQFITPRVMANEKKDYEIHTLLEYMIKYSDNYSYYILETFLSEDPSRKQLRDEIFQELGFFDPKTQELNTLTVRGYALLFRTLYNASFLTEKSSNLLLQLLAETEYSEALVAGIPQKDVLVAHKFGERQIRNQFQLHDCGIVYYPNHPYIFCMMTQGTNPLVLQGFIRELSNKIYGMVDEKHSMLH